MLGEVGGFPAGIDEKPAMPVDQPKFGQAELCVVEVIESGGIAQFAVELERPRVVRTDHAAPFGGGATGQQLMPAVPADVGERPHGSVLVTDQQDGVRTGTDRPLRPDTVEVGGVADAVPTGEYVALLPLEHRRIHVGLARKHAGRAERRQRRGECVGGDGGIVRLFEHPFRLVPGGV